MSNGGRTSGSNGTRARIDPAGTQTVEIRIDRGYRPDAIVGRADIPLRLVFRRDDDDPCMDRVVFSSPHLDRYLTPHSSTTIVLPAQAPGRVRFTCSFGRYMGEIELEDDQSPRPASPQPASHEDSPVALAIMLWVCSLPLVAVVMLVVAGPGAALLVSLMTLPGWIVACALRAGRGSGHHAPSARP